MNITILPKTKLGLWSTFLALSMVVIVFIGVITGLTDKLHPLFPILGWLSGAASVVVGIIAFIKNRERSVLIAVAVLLVILALVMGSLPQD